MNFLFVQQATSDEEHIPTVQSFRERRLRRGEMKVFPFFSPSEPGEVCLCTGFPSWYFCRPGVRLSGTGHREDVRLQETREEEDQEEERRVDGAEREADPGESQQQIRGKAL